MVDKTQLKTCKLLLKSGIILVILAVPFFFLGLFLMMSIMFIAIGLPLLVLSILGFVAGIVFLIISWVKWNTEKRDEHKEELRQAQINALNKGNVNISIKGKMSKLK